MLRRTAAPRHRKPDPLSSLFAKSTMLIFRMPGIE